MGGWSRRGWCIGRAPKGTVHSRPNGPGSQPYGAQGHPRAADRVPALSQDCPRNGHELPGSVKLVVTPPPPQPRGVWYPRVHTNPTQAHRYRYRHGACPCPVWECSGGVGGRVGGWEVGGGMGSVGRQPTWWHQTTACAPNVPHFAPPRGVGELIRWTAPSTSGPARSTWLFLTVSPPGSRHQGWPTRADLAP